LYSDPGRYYEESVSVGYGSFPDRFAHDRAIAEVRLKNMRRVFENPTGKVLDVGCGNCALTSALREAGYDASGVDLDSWSHYQSKAYSLIDGVESVCGDYLDYDDNARFDVVMFTDSFEHFLFPKSYAAKTINLLNDDGLVVLEMPDIDSEGWRSGGIKWRHVKPREHPFLYNEDHIRNLFDPEYTEVVQVIHTIPGRAVYYLRKIS
jgi:2-polyprenyl-3-methyl-5-hydroxy-6-metoxy-1,4-benzoquinol methylase